MASFFDSSFSYSSVPISETNEIDTKTFLEATESLIKLFDLLGSTAFSPVKSDMQGNVTKIRTKYITDPTNLSTLQKVVLSEVGQKKRTATEGLLWLKRGLDFTSTALRRNVDDSKEELSISFNKSYEVTLSKYHSFLIRPVFSIAMKACPYRKDFYVKLGPDSEKVNVQLRDTNEIDTLTFINATESVIKVIDLMHVRVFGPIRNDLQGNINKILKRFDTDPQNLNTLQKILLSEVDQEDRSATVGVLWLKRSLEFTSTAFRFNLENPNEPLKTSFRKSYRHTLSQYHPRIVRLIVRIALGAIPSRKDFYPRIGYNESDIDPQFNGNYFINCLISEWLSALEKNIDIIDTFLVQGEYDKV